MIHLIVGNRNNSPIIKMPNTTSYITNNKPLKKDYSWWMVDSETGEVIEQYIAEKEKRQKVDTPYAGSWAAMRQAS